MHWDRHGCGTAVPARKSLPYSCAMPLLCQNGRACRTHVPCHCCASTAELAVLMCCATAVPARQSLPYSCAVSNLIVFKRRATVERNGWIKFGTAVARRLKRALVKINCTGGSHRNEIWQTGHVYIFHRRIFFLMSRLCSSKFYEPIWSD